MTEPIEYICGDCGSVFEFDYKDIRRREVTSFGLFGDTMSKRFVVCPVCAYENEYSKIACDMFAKAEAERLGL